MTVYFNINNSIDMDTEPAFDPEAEKQNSREFEFVSKPNFKVELENGDTVFCIVCSFNGPDQEEVEQGYSKLAIIAFVAYYRSFPPTLPPTS